MREREKEREREREREKVGRGKRGGGRCLINKNRSSPWFSYLCKLFFLWCSLSSNEYDDSQVPSAPSRHDGLSETPILVSYWSGVLSMQQQKRLSNAVISNGLLHSVGYHWRKKRNNGSDEPAGKQQPMNRVKAFALCGSTLVWSYLVDNRRSVWRSSVVCTHWKSL